MAHPRQTIFLHFNNSKKLPEDLSAVVRVDADLWVASDEETSVEKLSLQSDGSFGNHASHSLEKFFSLPVAAPEDDREVDIEGLDVNQGYLWLVGSHSLKRKKAKGDATELQNIESLQTILQKGNRYLLARIPLENGSLYSEFNGRQAAKLSGSQTSSDLIMAMKDDPHLGLSLSIPSKENGLDIEGLAVFGNRVFLGLRGPVLRGIAVILELNVGEASGTSGQLHLEQLTGTSRLYYKHFVDLDGLGVRDLCFHGDDLLILAGPTMEADGELWVYRWENPLASSKDSFSKPRRLFQIPHQPGKDRAEGICRFPIGTQEEGLLVIYDSPSKSRYDKNATPRPYKADLFEIQSET